MIYFLTAFALSLLFALVVKKIATRLNIVDYPDNKRKKHKTPTALLGGIAIFLSFWGVLAYLIFFTNLIGKNITFIQLLIIFISSLALIILGYFDDKNNLSPKFRLIVTSLIILFVILFGIDLDGITNPLGGIISLDTWKWTITGWESLILIGDLIVFAWLMGMMYTAKVLDGLDGLTTGIIGIGAMMIFFLSSTIKFYQSDVAVIALVLAGSCFGFLILNFYKAKIYLGEGGGLFLGFMLGVLAVIAGGKIASALLVMAVPILDLAWVIGKRLTSKHSLFTGDRKHLHYRLVDSGWSVRQSVIFLYLISFIFGISTLVLPSKFKLLVLILLVVLFFILEKYIIKKRCL